MPRAKSSHTRRSYRSRQYRKAVCGRARRTASGSGSIEVADPFPICYLNGTRLPLEEARISPLDRGFLYADGAYELMAVYGGRPFRFDAHRGRMTRSLNEIQMRDPHTHEEWRDILGQLV